MGATSDVNFFIRQCRFFVNPSFYREGIPRTSLEAISHGRPIISTATPGNSEVVLNNHNGFSIPSNSTPHLVKAMVSMLELTNTQYQTFASNSRLLAEKRFDASAVAKKTAQLILNA